MIRFNGLVEALADNYGTHFIHSKAEGERVAMARGAVHLLGMAVIEISLLLGHAGGALSQGVTYERLLGMEVPDGVWG